MGPEQGLAGSSVSTYKSLEDQRCVISTWDYYVRMDKGCYLGTRRHRGATQGDPGNPRAERRAEAQLPTVTPGMQSQEEGHWLQLGATRHVSQVLRAPAASPPSCRKNKSKTMSPAVAPSPPSPQTLLPEDQAQLLTNPAL